MSKFSKRHYEVAAKAVHALLNSGYVGSDWDAKTSIMPLIHEFKRDNPRFDVDTFYDACGLQPRSGSANGAP